MDDLKNVFGDTLLTYLLAQDIDTIDEQRLTTEQDNIVNVLRSWLGQVAGRHPLEQRIALTGGLLAYAPDTMTSFANAARLACGGHIPEGNDTTDNVVNLLLHIGRDIYAGFLFPTDDTQFTSPDMSLGSAVFRHPQLDELCRAVYADETLKQLFPGDYSTIDATKPRALIGLHSEVIFSSGSGGGLQLIGLSERMLLAGYYRMLLAGPLSMAAYFTSLKTVLDEVRKLADGQSCQVPVIFGLANIELPPDTAVPVPWGTLYSPDRIDQTLVPGLVKVDGLLVTKRPLKILHIARFDPAAASQQLSANFARYQPQMTEWNTETNRTASLMRLAFLLASPETSFFAVQNASRTVLHPLQQMPLMQWSRQLLAAASTAGLDTAALSRVQEWAEQTQNHPKRLDIAMRRTLAAIADRTDLLDGFIDGVMAWENMFSGRPETNLRVCGAIAWLLEPADYQVRRQLFSELKDLYAKRSNLVHGAIETVSDPTSCRDRAVRIAVESMKRLYAHDELLHTKDSADRGGMILLGSELP